MKIRLSGDLTDVTTAVNLLRQVLTVSTVSRPFPNRREPGVRLYVQADLPSQQKQGADQ